MDISWNIHIYFQVREFFLDYADGDAACGGRRCGANSLGRFHFSIIRQKGKNKVESPLPVVPVKIGLVPSSVNNTSVAAPMKVESLIPSSRSKFASQCFI